MTPVAQRPMSERFPGALSYNWTLFPDDAGEPTGQDTVCVVNWNDEFIGDAFISVTALNECGEGEISEEKVVAIFLNVGVDQLVVSSMFIYPNPTSGLVNIQFGATSHQPVDILVMNAEGRLLYREKVGQGQQSAKLDFSHFRAGVYYIKIEHKDYRNLRKLIVLP